MPQHRPTLGPPSSSKEDEHFSLQSSSTFPRDEYDVLSPSFLSNLLRTTRKDTWSVVSAIISLKAHLGYFETLIVLCVSLASTSMFWYLYRPDGTHFAGGLRFNLIAYTIWLPATILVLECSLRRNYAMGKFANVKGGLCQILLMFLTWRSPGGVLGKEGVWEVLGRMEIDAGWENEMFAEVQVMAKALHAVLALPIVRERSWYYENGKVFAERVANRRFELVVEMARSNERFHMFVHDMKMRGLQSPEAIRSYQYLYLLQRDIEQLLQAKFIRTPVGLRSYVRVMLIVVIWFYGPYYSFVAGGLISVPPNNSGWTNFAFSICLTAATTFFLLGIVAMHRSLEDPFFSRVPGDVMDVEMENADLQGKLAYIFSMHRDGHTEKAQKYVESIRKAERQIPLPLTAHRAWFDCCS